ncbi:hypothetical protein BKA62DRAFT_265395 [Auriculariales sp. MPI-PUGE-AT-0066]|nr:hypothetical protein BKA62DRAFT_265395 [Auriculariales sp. MPI-PUGE-AT-0066]
MAGSANKTNSTSIPTPVGGVPDASDRAACIIFAATYFVLLLVLVYRLCRKDSRTWLLSATLGLLLERIIAFSFRALQAFDSQRRYTGGHLQYIQMTFSIGYFQLLQDLVPMFRVLLVHGTSGPDIIDPIHEQSLDETRSYDEKDSAFTNNTLVDDPVSRRRYRKTTEWFGLLMLVCTAPNIIQGVYYDIGLERQSIADAVQILRYVGASIFFAVTVGLAYWVFVKRNHCKPEAGVHRLLQILGLLMIISVYRLVVMRFRITDMHDMGPTSQNSPLDKACFYIFHVLPEWLAIALMVVPNTRKAFCWDHTATGVSATGRYGTVDGRDASSRSCSMVSRGAVAAQRRSHIHIHSHSRRYRYHRWSSLRTRNPQIQSSASFDSQTWPP